jgi:hypothetical protein
MSPSHSRKATGQRYRYYVSQALLQGRADEAGSVRRVSADVIESTIDRTLCEALPQLQRKAWSTSSMDQKRIRLRRLEGRVVISRDAVEVKVTDAGREALANAESGLLSIATVLKAGLEESRSSPATPPRLALIALS